MHKVLSKQKRLLCCTFLVAALVISGFTAPSAKVLAAAAYSFQINDAVTNGKVIVLLGPSGTMRTIDLKSHSVLFDSQASNKKYWLRSLIYDGKSFIGMEDTDVLWTSTDGKTWKSKNSSMSIQNIFYIDKQYVVIGDDGVYQSANLQSFKKVYTFSDDNDDEFYKIKKFGKTYYAVSKSYRTPAVDKYTEIGEEYYNTGDASIIPQYEGTKIWTSNNLKDWELTGFACFDPGDCTFGDFIQFNNKIYIPLTNSVRSDIDKYADDNAKQLFSSSKEGDIAVIENGEMNTYGLRNFSNSSGLLFISDINNKLYGATNEGVLVSINKDFSCNILPKQSIAYELYPNNFVCTIKEASDFLIVTEDNIYKMNSQGKLSSFYTTAIKGHK